MIRPAFPYYGGKTRLAPTIASLLPEHRIYLEPFAGSAAVLLAKPPSRHEIVNDVDGAVVSFYRAMREDPERLHYVLALTPYSRREYEMCADLGEHLDDVERARRFVVRSSQSINAAGAAGSPGWAVSTTRNQSRPGTFAGAIDRLPIIAERLRRVYVEQGDAVALIERHGRASDAVIYADPPYVPSTRRTTGSSAYRHDTTLEQHDRILDALLATSATVVLSGYDNQLYRERLEGWRRVEVSAGKPSANRSGARQSASVEVLWMNR